MQKIAKQTTVAVFTEDPVLGRALERLLSRGGYHVRLLEVPPTRRELTAMLDGVHLALLCPNLTAELREDLLLGVESVRERARIPVLELARVACNGGGGDDERVSRVPWPCAMEELHHRFDDALQEGMATPQPPPLYIWPVDKPAGVRARGGASLKA